MNQTRLLNLRGTLAMSPELWQYRLLDSDALCRYANEHGVSIVRGETVASLWRAGLLRADIVAAKSGCHVPGLVAVRNGSTVSYCDARRIEPHSQGFGGAFGEHPELLTEVDLLFHPFRLYVLYHVARVFKSQASSTQYLSSTAGVLSIAQHDIDTLDRWTASSQFGDRFDYWNMVAELSAVCDPVGCPVVFNERRMPMAAQDALDGQLDQYRQRLSVFLAGLGVGEIEKSRVDLCHAAEFMDGNTLIHVLLRLMSSHERHKLHGAIGGCMLLLTMAETIRRAAEGALKEQLREEDELGLGQWMEGARKTIYGSERILDAPSEVKRDFLTSLGLDAGVKVRCYVEGDTEIGALRSAFGGAPQIEFVNLRGQFVERHGRGLQFTGSLANDRKSHVFSIVVLDGDDEDNIRVVRKAAIDGAVFAPFCIFDPDVEFANFTIDELVAVAIDLARRRLDVIPPAKEILLAVGSSSSGREFFKRLGCTALAGLGKNEEWGAALMRHALQAELLPSGHPRAGAVRPLIDAARLLMRARGSGYVRSVEKATVDPQTGEVRGK